MGRADEAVALKHAGHNCCQAVLVAFEDKVPLDANALRGLGAGFGAGMGRMGATCGALCAAEMLLGLVTYEGRPLSRDAGALYARFDELCGATICAELKGRGTGVPLCACDDCVRHAVQALEERLA